MTDTIVGNPPTRPLQEDRVRQHFESVAVKYASFYEGETSEAHSFSVRLARVLEMLPARLGRLVDLGCGPGLLMRRVLEQRPGSSQPTAPPVGIDFATSMLREAAAQLSGVGGRRAHLVCASGGGLPLRSGAADTVVCMGLMEYLDDEHGVLAEIARVLSPGGVVIITLPNVRSPYRLWHRLMNRLFGALRAMFPRSERLKNVEFMVGPFTKGVAHREYAEGEYRARLRRFGLEPVDVCYYNFKLFLTPLDKWCPRATVRVSRRLERWGRHPVLRFLATAFIIKARRGER